jgi:hypothetical protein
MGGLWVASRGDLETGEFEKGSMGYLGRKSMALRVLAEEDAIWTAGEEENGKEGHG